MDPTPDTLRLWLRCDPDMPLITVECPPNAVPEQTLGSTVSVVGQLRLSGRTWIIHAEQIRLYPIAPKAIREPILPATNANSSRRVVAFAPVKSLEQLLAEAAG